MFVYIKCDQIVTNSTSHLCINDIASKSSLYQYTSYDQNDTRNDTPNTQLKPANLVSYSILIQNPTPHVHV